MGALSGCKVTSPDLVRPGAATRTMIDAYDEATTQSDARGSARGTGAGDGRRCVMSPERIIVGCSEEDRHACAMVVGMT
jgi:hypothetical protein